MMQFKGVYKCFRINMPKESNERIVTGVTIKDVSIKTYKCSEIANTQSQLITKNQI